EEVAAHEAPRLRVVFGELAHDVVSALGAVQRAEVGELAWRDQHAARVHTHIAREPFEALRQLEQLTYLFLLSLALSQQRLHLACHLERDEPVGLKRNELGELVAEV